jgi:hypothetical protein
MFKKTLLTLATVIALSTSANAALVAYWNLENGYAGTATASENSTSGATTAATGGTLTMAPVDAIIISAGVGAGAVNQAGGDAQNSAVTDMHLADSGGQAVKSGYTITYTVTNPNFYVTGLGISFADKSSASRTFTHTFQVVYNGTTNSAGVLAYSSATAFTAQGFTFTNSIPPQTVTSFTVIDAVVITGSGGSFNSYDLDNIQITGNTTAVPEPINVSLALFGVVFCGVKFGRRLLGLVRA